MIIWFAAAIPSDARGGVGRVMVSLASELSLRGHRVRQLYGDGMFGGNYLVFALILAVRMLWAGSRSPDWLIARSSDGVVCAAICRLLGLQTSIILHNHGWEEHVCEVEARLPRSALTNPTTWKAQVLRLPLLRAALRWSTVCVSGTVAEVRWLAQHYPRRRAKLRYIANGVLPREQCFWGAQQSLPPKILFVGGPTWKKNFGYARELLRRLRSHITDAQLVVVGPGHASGSCEGTGDDEQTDGIRLVASAPPDQMESWYAECPYLICCSRYEGGHSLAVLEAMSFGAIVFCSAIFSSREFIVHGRNGFMISGDRLDEDARVMADVMADPSRGTPIRMAAWSAASRHRWQRQTSRWEALLCSKQ